MAREVTLCCRFVAFCLIFVCAIPGHSQTRQPSETQPQASQQQPTQPEVVTQKPSTAQEHPAKPVRKNDRIFGVIPNYRTVEDEASEPTKLTSREKFKLGLQDSFDYYAYPSAAIFAGIAMLQKQTPSFGQGAAGFGRYYATAFADETIGNMLAESVFPTVLHQDPRYFPLAKAGVWKRTRYSISREWLTRNDSGKTAFNFSELGGNAAAVAISNLYYPSENRTFSNNVQKYGQQIGLDAFFNILKEFWPDIHHKMFGD